jgi:hypothetical protein
MNNNNKKTYTPVFCGEVGEAPPSGEAHNDVIITVSLDLIPVSTHGWKLEVR